MQKKFCKNTFCKNNLLRFTSLFSQLSKHSIRVDNISNHAFDNYVSLFHAAFFVILPLHLIIFSGFSGATFSQGTITKHFLDHYLEMSLQAMIVSHTFVWWHSRWFEIAFTSHIQISCITRKCERYCKEILFEALKLIKGM